ncbi:hypothetical protein ES703_91860 [subsurface metagenome]
MKRHPEDRRSKRAKRAKFWLQYGAFILALLAFFQFYLAYLAFSDRDWLMVAVHLFAGLVALGVGVWIAKLRWFTRKEVGRGKTLC